MEAWHDGSSRQRLARTPLNWGLGIMSTQLGELIRQAADLTRGHRYWGVREKEILRILDAAGKRNRHLVNPMNRDREVPYFRPRQTPLTGDELVYGKYLTMHYCGHDVSSLLFDFDCIEELEKDLLSGAGILNCWTTYVFAFIDGQLRDYEVAVTFEDGSTFTYDNHKGQNAGVPGSLPVVTRAELRWRRC